MSKRSIYLDYAAATPLDSRVMDAMQPFFADRFYNPSAGYLSAIAVKKDIQKARTALAHALGVRPAEIVFCAGATEANNLALQGVMKNFSDCEIIASSTEHESVIQPAKLFKHKLTPVKSNGSLDINALERQISGRTVLVSAGLVNNEIGSLQPLKKISEIIAYEKKKRANEKNQLPLYLHTDAAQASNYFKLNAKRLGVDMLVINGGKIYGPKQSAAIYIKSGTQIAPLILGGGQEGGMRAGTENVASATGLATAFVAAQHRQPEEHKRIQSLKDFFLEEIKKNFPIGYINGPDKLGAPHIVSLTLPGFDNERLMMELDELGIQCATGSACSASKQTPSHVLAAIGLSKEDIRSTLRFSMGRSTTKEKLLETVKTLKALTGSTR